MKPKTKKTIRKKPLTTFHKHNLEFLAEQIDAVATIMWALAEHMESFTEFDGEIFKHSHEMAGASITARTWAEGIRSNMEKIKT